MFNLQRPKKAPDNLVIVYHIVHKDHKLDIDQGYIGVTGNLERRKEQHFEALQSGNHRNHKLQSYYNEHSASILMYVYKSFPANKEKFAYKLEEFLRPHANVGLNIAVGGKKTDDELFNAKQYSQNAEKRSYGSNLLSGLTNSLKLGIKDLLLMLKRL